MKTKTLWAFLVAGLFLFSPVASQADQQVRITVPAASIHSKPDSSSQVLFVARADQTFALVANQGDWIEIVTSQGIHGFVFHTMAFVPPPPGAPAAPAANDNGQPNVDHSPVGCLVAGKFPKLDAGFIPPEIARARVYFKAGGTSKWYYVEMTTGEGRYIGILPKPKKSLKKIDYYISGLNKASLEGRTQDYSPDVVEKDSECGSKPKAAYVPQANVTVGGGIPEGFELAGIVGAATGVGAGTAGVAAAGHTTAILIGGGVLAAGAATAVIVHNNNSNSCTPAGFTFNIDYGFTGPLQCSQTNTVQQNYTIDNKTCKTLTITGLSVSYQFTGQCTNANTTQNLALNGATSIANGKTAVIRTGAPAGQARTFCCPTPPCAAGTCMVQETFNLETSGGNMTLVNNFSVTSGANNCPACSLPHADSIMIGKKDSSLPAMCFEGESAQ